MPKGELYEFACTRIAETDKAIKVVDHATGEEIWLPLSQIESMHWKGNEGTVVMTAWIAKQKGLI